MIKSGSGMTNKKLIIEVFTNYGYVLVEDTLDGWYEDEDEGIIPYKDWYDFGFEYIPTGQTVYSGWPEYKHQGPHSIVRKTIEERYPDEPDIIEEVMEGWTKL